TSCCRTDLPRSGSRCASRRSAAARSNSRSPGPTRRAVPPRVLEPRPRAPHPDGMDIVGLPQAGPEPGYQSLQRPIDFTPAAAAKVKELLAEAGNAALKLRVYIQGGGCSGFQYGFEFDEEQSGDDVAVDTDGVVLVVDPLSLQYLMGSAVDYVESL